MTTYDDNMLATRFAALAPEPMPGDWDDILDRAGVARGSSRFAGFRMPRRRRLLVVLVAVALVAMVAASAFAVRAFVLDRGLVGLPPVGATPSAPETGELVLEAYVVSARRAEVGRTNVWVYSDGRLISKRSVSSGWLEQRLTAEGVERMRSEITSTGLFSNDRTLSFDGGAYGQPCFNFIRVRNGDPLVEVAWSGSCPPDASVQPAERATPEQAEILERLIERVADPGSWLPAESWEQREPRGYVPSRFAVCYGATPPTPQARSMERSRALSLLPAGARDILGGKDVFEVSGMYSGGPGDLRPTTDYCSDVTVDEARKLADALDPGVPTQKGGGARLNYEIAAPAPSRETVDIYFEPYLPHGEFICSPCG